MTMETLMCPARSLLFSVTLRQEMTLALRSSAQVIPVLVGGASMPAPDALPPAVRPLAQRQAVTVLDADWQRGVRC
jgi:hypothetical protein